MLRILNISKYFYPKFGGIESRNIEVGKYLAKKGHKVYTLTSKFEKNLKNFEIYEGIEIRRHKILLKAFNDVFYPGIIKDIFKVNYNIVHVDLPDPINSIFAFFASILKSKPLFITYHADIEKEELERFPANLILNFYNVLLKLILRRARKIFVTSKDYAKSSRILKKFEFEDEKKGKLILSPNFVDINTMKFDMSLEENLKKIEYIREKLNLKGEKILLFVGRLVPYKGVEYLIEAFKKVEEETSDVVLLIIGDGILRKQLEEMAKDSKGIKFLGKVDDLIPYYALCDIFVLPSITRQEAFGLVLIEAMYFGKTCITTDIESGMKYVVDYGNAGILVRAKDADRLKEAIIKLIANEDLRNKMGKMAKERVLERFEKRIVCEKIEKELIAEKGDKLKNGEYRFYYRNESR